MQFWSWSSAKVQNLADEAESSWPVRFSRSKGEKAYDFGEENTLDNCGHVGAPAGSLGRMWRQLEHQSMLWDVLYLKLQCANADVTARCNEACKCPWGIRNER